MQQPPHPARLGHYRLLRRLGVGGMAEVFEAVRGEGTAPRLALKVLLPQLRGDQHMVTSFIDEARICAELSHPNIVAVHDFGQVDGIYYMAMEFVDGIDLRELLRKREPAGLPVAAAAYVAHEVATGLHYIHTSERRIVHRDVTPHNVFLTHDGYVKLADFGVAKARARLTHTKTGRIKGKLAYLAPEQVRGDPVSARTDVFAVGLLLYEMLTGRRANAGQTDVELLDRAMNPRCAAPSQSVAAAAPLDSVVAQALARHPAMRTRDAALLADQLEAYLAGQPFSAHELQTLINQSAKPSTKVSTSLRQAPTRSVEEQGPRWRETSTVPAGPAPLAALDSVVTRDHSGERTNPRYVFDDSDTVVGTQTESSLAAFATGSMEMTVPEAPAPVLGEPPPRLVPPVAAKPTPRRTRQPSRPLSAARPVRPSTRLPAKASFSPGLSGEYDDNAATSIHTVEVSAARQAAWQRVGTPAATPLVTPAAIPAAPPAANPAPVVAVANPPSPAAHGMEALPPPSDTAVDPTAEVSGSQAPPRFLQPAQRGRRFGALFWLAVLLATAALVAVAAVVLSD